MTDATIAACTGKMASDLCNASPPGQYLQVCEHATSECPPLFCDAVADGRFYPSEESVMACSGKSGGDPCGEKEAGHVCVNIR